MGYKGTIFKTDGTSEQFSIHEDGSLEKLQEMVGGLIQIVPLKWKSGKRMMFDLLVNEEGLLFDLPKNSHSDFINHGTNFEGHTYVGNLVMVYGGLK